MKVLFAHNALSSYEPKNLIGKLLNIWSKCQSKNLSELYASSVRGFDFRLRYDRKRGLVVCHGLTDYDIDIREAMNELVKLHNEPNKNIFIRFINEDTLRRSNSIDFLQEVYKLIAEYPKFKYQVYSSNKYWVLDSSDFTEQVLELCSSKVFPFTPKYIANKGGATYKAIYKQLRNGFLFLDFI